MRSHTPIDQSIIWCVLAMNEVHFMKADSPRGPAVIHKQALCRQRAVMPDPIPGSWPVLASLSRLAAALPDSVPHGLLLPATSTAAWPEGLMAGVPVGLDPPARPRPLFCTWGCSRFDAPMASWHLWSCSCRCLKQKFLRQVPQET